MSDLFSFLNQKPMYYDKIDYERFPKAFNAIKKFFFLPKIIHIVGTNGKGSTGRFLALILQANGKKVAHFTSPHLFKFNERFWLNSHLASDDDLQKAHLRLLEYFKKANCKEFINELSYFEWATLLACELFKGQDEVIFEAGMGGEFDATNVLDKKLSIFTPIGLDHIPMLGTSLDEIATTKLKAMGQTAILSPFFAKKDLALNIAKNYGTELKIASKSAQNKAVKYYTKKFPLFLRQNFILALSSAHLLGAKFDFFVLKKMKKFDLAGRLQKISPFLSVDVGHNAHAAKEILQSLSTKKVKLVYNCFADKDAKAILQTLAPCLDEILIYEYKSEKRTLATTFVQNIAQELKIPCGYFNFKEFFEKISTKRINCQYLVFGSFMLVSEFLAEFYSVQKK